MWLSKHFVLPLLMIVLAGCGFRPLYGPSGSDGNVPGDLSAIQIDLIADRTGQQLHNQLLDLLTPRGRPAKPLYILKVSLTERTSEIAVKSTGLATRANVFVDARFTLVSIDTGKQLTKGTARAFSSYNLTDSEFSNLTAEQDSLSRAAREIAIDIRSRLGAYFSERSTV
jgi:LPS-assembly lipoprotein